MCVCACVLSLTQLKVIFCLQLHTRVLVHTRVRTRTAMHSHVFASSQLKRCLCHFIRNATLLCVGQRAFCPAQGETYFTREGGNEGPGSKLASVSFFHTAAPSKQLAQPLRNPCTVFPERRGFGLLGCA